ncbi:hypothetical protein LCGC14_0624160 [marine sediment metagenome]|uniref:RNA polymerase sigma factor 70 region 4 type 2 domain-containing protein n=1 Tax=marine sediment metagenome TaxID=412755 RepID=A0A0F9UCI2_9ZZZZ
MRISTRGPLIDLGEEFPKLTEKQRDALICVHPHLDGLSHNEAAQELGISRASLEDRLQGTYKRVLWLQEDMKRKRTEAAKVRRSIRNPIRLGDMSGIGSDGTTDTFFGEKIVGKF